MLFLQGYVVSLTYTVMCWVSLCFQHHCRSGSPKNDLGQ